MELMALWCWPERQTYFVNFMSFVEEIKRIGSRKFSGSIPDCVIGVFHSHNPSDRTMALGSTQPLTEKSTKNISWWVKAAGA